MREAIGGSLLFQIVIVFLLLFAGYICLAINYSKAFKVKNEVVDIIERDGSLEKSTIVKINAYLSESGYFSSGTCPSNTEGSKSNWFGYSTNETDVNTVSPTVNGVGNYCIKEMIVNAEDGGIGKKYYQVKLFFKFEIPVFGDLFNFSVSGDTEQL